MWYWEIRRFGDGEMGGNGGLGDGDDDDDNDDDELNGMAL